MVITITGSIMDLCPQNAKFNGSKYVSTKKPQYKRAHENLGVYSILQGMKLQDMTRIDSILFSFSFFLVL